MAFKKYDGGVQVFQPKQLKIAEMKAFVENNLSRRLGELSEKQFKKIYEKNSQGIVLVSEKEESVKRLNEFAL